MLNTRKENKIYLISLFLLAFFSLIFVSTMGYLNYRTTAINLEESVIAKFEKDNVDLLETAINFGKRFDNYYGMEDVLETFANQYKGPIPFVIDKDGNLLYYLDKGETHEDTDNVRAFIESKTFKRGLPELMEKEGKAISHDGWNAIFSNIHEDGEIIGYLGCIYKNKIFKERFDELKQRTVIITFVVAVTELIAIAFLVVFVKKRLNVLKNDGFTVKTIKKLGAVGAITLGIIIMSGVMILVYQSDYRSRIEVSVKASLKNLENSIQHVREQGVDLREVDGLYEYIDEKISELETIHAVRITERITEVKRTQEDSAIISFTFGADDETGTTLYLDAEISDELIAREMRNIVLVLLSSMIILSIFVFELNNVMDLSTEKISAKGNDTFSEKQVSLALRLTGFLCSTAEYMCVPYAAMMIRDSGEALPGISLGFTAALPLTIEGLTQMIGMLTLPKVVKKYDVKKVLIVSSIAMILCNITAFAVGGALTIVICRALAGYSYAGFKQVSNYLITKGYETEKGRSDNISQDNAGLLAGATCGAGLGAILSANAGYPVTFLISGAMFIFYLLGTWYLVPWMSLEAKAGADEEEKPISMSGIAKMFTSLEMIFFILVIAIPLNIGVMLCVTLIPAICQINNISSIVLSYCYIANGIAGIYIGPSLVSRAKAKFGLQPCIAFAFALTSICIFILKLPPVAVMVIISSMALGFLDGFGTPMVTDRFMSLRIVQSSIDESTSLIFFVVLSYVLLTFAPMIAELMLMQTEGVLSPMLIGAIVYGVAAVLLFLFNRRQTEKAS
ncbi:MAG: MFS transporter [Oribacterium sp.]|nr:MFS transporter [Oribacterium sp.]MBO6308146.1 MFS transporter [Oribacterium sp.]